MSKLGGNKTYCLLEQNLAIPGKSYAIKQVLEKVSFLNFAWFFYFSPNILSCIVD